MTWDLDEDLDATGSLHIHNTSHVLTRRDSTCAVLAALADLSKIEAGNFDAALEHSSAGDVGERYNMSQAIRPNVQPKPTVCYNAYKQVGPPTIDF